MKKGNIRKSNVKMKHQKQTPKALNQNKKDSNDN